MTTKVALTINGVLHSIDTSIHPDITPNTTLNDYIRHHTPLMATKKTCGEGGCGACTVALTYKDPATASTVTRSINSCLALLFSLNGMSVTTNEGIGSAAAGYSTIQKELAHTSGTQCGYCSGGMVMTLYSYLKENPNATELELERVLDGNLCRCTGYRPILECFKHFAGSSTDEASSGSHNKAREFLAEVKACVKDNCCKKQQRGAKHADIEDTAAALFPMANPPKQFHVAKPSKTSLTASAAASSSASSAVVWQDVTTLKDLSYYMNHYSGKKVMLTVGATSFGVYRADEYSVEVYLNIAQIPELAGVAQDSTGLTIGGGVTIHDAITALRTTTTSVAAQTAHFGKAADHLFRIAGYSIRNRASIGGNLMVCHNQRNSKTDPFPSDASVVFMGLGATLTLYEASTKTTSTVSMTSFFGMSMAGYVLQSITIPFASSTATEVFNSYKIAIRQVMDHALVNAACKATIDTTKKEIKGTPTIAIGGIGKTPTRYTTVEAAMSGLKYTNVTDVVKVCKVLEAAVAAAIDSDQGRVAYRTQVAVNYVYKFLLELQGSGLPGSLALAQKRWMDRSVSSGKQDYQTHPSEYPVSYPMPKYDALTQTAGEAIYTGDIPTPNGCLFAAYAYAQQAGATFTIDKSVLTGADGFVKFYDATDLTTAQNATALGKVFASGAIDFCSQPLGLVVASSQTAALRLARIVEAATTYVAQTTPLVLTVQEAIAAKTEINNAACAPVTVERPGSDVATALAGAATVISGTLNIGSQYHFHMENHAVLVQPAEGGLTIDCASQGPVLVQKQVAQTTGLDRSVINVRTRRCGGGFGGKAFPPTWNAAAAALACLEFNMPVRFDLEFKDGMKNCGSRPEYQNEYKMGVDSNNQIVALDCKLHVTCGSNGGGAAFEVNVVCHNIDNCYNIPNFRCKAIPVGTQVPPVTPVRGPGWIQSILLAEMMMNQAAHKLGISRETFRAANFYKNGDTTPDGQPIRGTEISTVWNKLLAEGDYTNRVAAVESFNKANKFVKRGVSVNPARFRVSWNGGNFDATVAVNLDGSVSVVHGGCEIGQGINTKVMQAVAFKLGIDVADLETVRCHPNTTTVCPSMGNVTGSSITSELCCLAAMRACEEINARLEPYRSPWLDFKLTAAAASAAGVNLTATGYTQTKPGGRYNSWGATMTEVEVDCLTGQSEIRRVDLMYDCGKSLSPIVDIGQIEGGFMMGVGWFTSEIVKYNSQTGDAEMAGSWRYKPPAAYDVPEKFHVTILENSENKVGVLSSKAVGEPPLALACSVVHAIEDAVNACRKEVGHKTLFQCSSVPLTVEQVQRGCGISSSDLVVQ